MSKLDKARELEAEAKALRRAEKEFWSDIDERKDEVIKHLGVGQFDELCLLYGAYTAHDKQRLLEYLKEEEQIDQYRVRDNQQSLPTF